MGSKNFRSKPNIFGDSAVFCGFGQGHQAEAVHRDRWRFKNFVGPDGHWELDTSKEQMEFIDKKLADVRHDRPSELAQSDYTNRLAVRGTI